MKGYHFDLFSSPGNVAYNKSTEQTGAWGGHTSERAVDGDTRTDQGLGSCAHPYDPNITQAWWRVDMGSLHMIYNVTIYNTNAWIGK